MATKDEHDEHWLFEREPESFDDNAEWKLLLVPYAGRDRTLPVTPRLLDFSSAWPEPRCPLHGDGYCNCFDEALF